MEAFINSIYFRVLVLEQALDCPLLLLLMLTGSQVVF